MHSLQWEREDMATGDSGLGHLSLVSRLWRGARLCQRGPMGRLRVGGFIAPGVIADYAFGPVAGPVRSWSQKAVGCHFVGSRTGDWLRCYRDRFSGRPADRAWDGSVVLPLGGFGRVYRREGVIEKVIFVFEFPGRKKEDKSITEVQRTL